MKMKHAQSKGSFNIKYPQYTVLGKMLSRRPSIEERTTMAICIFDKKSPILLNFKRKVFQSQLQLST